MVSSDKDLYQLVDTRTIQWSPGQKIFVTPSVILEKFGIHPNNFCTARCFVGDPSDGLPGVKGAGFKTLAKRFEELRGSDSVSVEDIIQRVQLATSLIIEGFNRFGLQLNLRLEKLKLSFVSMVVMPIEFGLNLRMSFREVFPLLVIMVVMFVFVVCHDINMLAQLLELGNPYALRSKSRPPRFVSVCPNL